VAAPSDEVSTFLTSRRARITPERAGVVSHGHRRVAGLRREEVAQLAGVSTDYYARMERGDLGGASEEVLDALARALQLDEPEREHLFDLARTAAAGSRARRRTAPARRPALRAPLQQVLDAITDAPAFVRTGSRDVLAANALGRALYSPLYESARLSGHALPNSVRFAFLDPRARTYFSDWERTADDAVAALRGEAGRTPYDRSLTDLVGELATRSEEFRTRWAAHDVRHHRSGTKHLHHPVVGDLVLTFEVMDLPADPGLTLAVYTAAPGSPSADALQLLASWAAETRTGGAPAPSEPRSDAP